MCEKQGGKGFYLKASGLRSVMDFIAWIRFASNLGIFSHSIQWQAGWQYNNNRKQSQYIFKHLLFLQLQVAAAFPPVICGTTATGIADPGVPSRFYVQHTMKHRKYLKISHITSRMNGGNRCTLCTGLCAARLDTPDEVVECFWLGVLDGPPRVFVSVFTGIGSPAMVVDGINCGLIRFFFGCNIFAEPGPSCVGFSTGVGKGEIASNNNPAFAIAWNPDTTPGGVPSWGWDRFWGTSSTSGSWISSIQTKRNNNK